MRECPLESSILGSIIPTLDPDPPQPFRKRKNASFAGDTAPPEEPGSKLLLSTGRSGAAEPEGGGPQDRAGGDAGVAVSGVGASGGGVGGGTAVDQKDEAGSTVVKTRKPRVKHGLRVLVRGTCRCCFLYLRCSTMLMCWPFFFLSRRHLCGGAIHSRGI